MVIQVIAILHCHIVYVWSYCVLLESLAGNTFCTVETRHDQWVLEYNLVTDSSAFTVRSAQPLPTTEASPLTWHLRLGHPNTVRGFRPSYLIGAR